MCCGGRNRKVYLTKIRSPLTTPPCETAILRVFPPRLCDDCDGIATHRLTTCSAPFTMNPNPIGVVHHRRIVAVGASDNDAEKLTGTNEVVLQCYRMTSMKVFIVNVVYGTTQ